MPRTKKYENRIPAFYRKQTLDLLMFAHVTALREFTLKNEKYTMKIEDAIDDFYEVYCIDPDELPIESALVTYSRIKNNFLWSELKRKIKT